MILRFILLKIRAHKIRSIIVILSTLLMSLFLSSLLFVYSNIVAFNNYYQLDGIDPHRVSITSDTSFFELFGKEKSGLSEAVERQIKNDPLIDRSHFLTFVEIPVLAQMDIFSFHLATDIPVFGICLGHQLIAAALDIEVIKLPFGQRGAIGHGRLDQAALLTALKWHAHMLIARLGHHAAARRAV